MSICRPSVIPDVIRDLYEIKNTYLVNMVLVYSRKDTKLNLGRYNSFRHCNGVYEDYRIELIRGVNSSATIVK